MANTILISHICSTLYLYTYLQCCVNIWIYINQTNSKEGRICTKQKCKSFVWKNNVILCSPKSLIPYINNIRLLGWLKFDFYHVKTCFWNYSPQSISSEKSEQSGWPSHFCDNRNCPSAETHCMWQPISSWPLGQSETLLHRSVILL